MALWWVNFTSVAVAYTPEGQSGKQSCSEIDFFKHCGDELAKSELS